VTRKQKVLKTSVRCCRTGWRRARTEIFFLNQHDDAQWFCDAPSKVVATGRNLRLETSKGLMTHVSDVMKTEHSANDRLCRYSCQAAVILKFSNCGADDNSLYTQEPDAGKLARPVL